MGGIVGRQNDLQRGRGRRRRPAALRLGRREEEGRRPLQHCSLAETDTCAPREEFYAEAALELPGDVMPKEQESGW